MALLFFCLPAIVKQVLFLYSSLWPEHYNYVSFPKETESAVTPDKKEKTKGLTKTSYPQVVFFLLGCL